MAPEQPAIQTAPTAAQGLTIITVPGVSTAAAIAVYGNPDLSISVTITSSPSWLALISAPTTANGHPIMLSANGTGLQAGQTYTGQVVIASSIIIPVTLYVLQPGSCLYLLTANSAMLNSAGTASSGGFAPEIPLSVGMQPVSGTIGAGSYTVTPGSAWLAARGLTTSGFAYTALSNPSTQPRAATLTIADANGGLRIIPVVEAGDNSETLVRRQVRALYQTVFNRDPDIAGFAFWTSSGATPLSQMADSFVTSPEAFNSDFAVMATYQAATGVPPTYAQFTASVAALGAGTQTIGGLFNALIAGNPGYSAANLYENLLGRAPSPSEAVNYESGPASWFQTLIGFPATTTPAAAPNNEFQSTAAGNLYSDGSYGAPTDHTNALYITMLYYVILGRDPDPLGLPYWIGIANAGGSGILFQGQTGFQARFDILGSGSAGNGFLGSLEFQSLYQ